MKTVLAFVVALALLFSVPARAAQDPLIKKYMSATALLFHQQGSGGLKFDCTATAYEKTDVGYLLATAAHCFEGNGPTAAAFVVFDEHSESPYIRAKLLFKDAQTDVAVLGIVTALDIPVIPLGDENLEQVGNEVYNVASPSAIGKVFFRGTISSLRLEPRVREDNMHASIGAQLTAQPGSSGSSVVSPTQGAIIGILVQVYMEDSDVFLTAIVPVSDLKKAINDYKFGKPSAHDETLELIFGSAPTHP